MRTVLTIIIFIGALALADMLVNDGNLVEPIWKLIVRTIR